MLEVFCSLVKLGPIISIYILVHLTMISNIFVGKKNI